MTKIVLIRSNPVNPDPRLEKEAETLGKSGYKVAVLGWGRWKTTVNTEIKSGYTIYRIPLKAPVGIRIIVFWPVWWFFEFAWLMRNSWDIVHAADFDTYIPALAAAKIRHKKIIYDIYDFYPDMIKLPSGIQKIFSRFDKYLMKYADAVVIVDKCRLKQIDRKDDSSVTILYNTPNEYSPADVLSSSPTDGRFNIFYGGFLQPDRDVASMIKVVSEIRDCNLTIAGGGHTEDVQNIKNLSKNTQNVTYLGVIPYHDILMQSSKADLLFALYDPAVPNNLLASPNKLFESMMCGKPIIVNEGAAAADKVREENCGCVVPFNDYDALKTAVISLKDNPDLRKKMGQNGRIAYDTKYNWNLMEKRLLNLYASLI